jgi:hypothetical protein
MHEAVKLRSHLILSAVSGYAPDLLLVDKKGAVIESRWPLSTGCLRAVESPSAP